MLSSCAATKPAAEAGEQPAAETVAKAEPEPEVAAASETPVELPAPDEGFRMSGLLDLPTDGEFRPSTSALGRPGASASPVISRPPTDPPSRIKPKVEEPAE